MSNYIATGIEVSFGTLAGEIVDANKANDEVETQDVTHQLSANQWREHSGTNALKQGGDVSLTAHWGGTVPSLGSEDTLTLSLPGSKSVSATAILKSAGGHNGTLGQKITTEMTFQVTGEPTYT